MNSKQVNETVNRLLSFMQDVKNGNLRTILANMQKMNDYMAEKIRIYEEHLTALTGRAHPELTDSDKRRLAQKGKALNDFLLAAVEPTWAPGTLRNWYNSLVGAKYESTGTLNQRKRGRKLDYKTASMAFPLCQSDFATFQSYEEECVQLENLYLDDWLTLHGTLSWGESDSDGHRP